MWYYSTKLIYINKHPKVCSTYYPFSDVPFKMLIHSEMCITSWDSSSITIQKLFLFLSYFFTLTCVFNCYWHLVNLMVEFCFSEDLLVVLLSRRCSVKILRFCFIMFFNFITCSHLVCCFHLRATGNVVLRRWK